MGVFKKKSNVIVLVFFIASLLFVLYSFIFNKNENDSSKIHGYTPEQVAIYTQEEYIVHDYNKFYTLEEIEKQIIQAMSEKKYNLIYSKTNSDIVGDISKAEYAKLLSDFYEENFTDVKDENGNITQEYDNARNLDYLYKVKDNEYIVEIKNNHDTTTKMGIKLKNNNTYEIVYIEF